ncbi:MAG: segregation/condensation protein A [Sarcina sp.]
MSMPIIKISNFDGPFNLLLHLIKKNEMNINEIKIEEIIKQYLNYINLMKELDLEITSEFIVIAATLIEIKSKTLLPKEKQEEEDSEDLAKELLNKLNEYKKFKLITEYFKNKDLDLGVSYTKKPEIIEEIETPENYNYLKNTTMLDLYNLYNKLMRLYNEKQNDNNVIEKKIKADQYKIDDKINVIRESIRFKSILNFTDIIINCQCKLELVVTFLALLEMIKNNEIKVVQNTNFEEIIIERNNEIG